MLYDVMNVFKVRRCWCVSE